MGQRGQRSKATEAEVVKAAFELLGEGPQGLTTLGLTQAALAARMGMSSGTINYHFGRKAARSLARALASALHEQIVEEAARNAEDYGKAARDLDAGARTAGRALIRRVLLEDLADYRADAYATLVTRGRERLYYLMLALSDLDPKQTTVDYAAQLRDTTTVTQEGYVRAYDAFCKTSHREYVVDRTRTQRAINAYLEGVNAHERFGASPGDEEVVDTVLRLFHITTKPIGGADLDIDADLFGTPTVSESRSVGAHSTVHATREALFEELQLAMDALSPDEVLLHCAMHRPLDEDRPPADPLSRRLFEAQHAHIARGGAARRVVRYWRVKDLENDLRWIARLRDREPRALVETRALIADTAPVLSTMVVGERIGAIAREDPLTARLVEGVTFTDPPGVRFCEGTFAGIATDPRAYLIASPNGIHARGVEDARRRLLDQASPYE